MKLKVHYAWAVLATATLVVFGSLGLARFGYTALLPEMQRGLALDNSQAGAVASANLVGYLVLALFGGALAARFGPRAVISAGMVVAAVGMVLTALAGSFMSTAALRALTGVGSGASNVPVMALLSAWFGPRRRGLASGIGVAGSSVAMILVGMTVPGVLTRFGPNGWRVTWVLFGVVSLLIALASSLFLRNSPHSMGLAPLGETRSSATPGSKGSNLQWGSVYRSPLVWQTGMVYMAYGFSYIIYITFFKKYLVAEAGYSQESAGSLFMLLGWFSLGCGLIWGSVSDRVGRRAALVMVYIIQSLAFALFTLKAMPGAIVVSTILFGITAWSIPAIMAALCGDLLGTRLAPAGLGFVTLFFGFGQALGPFVAGIIADKTASFSPAFWLAAAIAIVGAGGSAALRATQSSAVEMAKETAAARE